MKNVTLRLLYSSYAPLQHVVVARGSMEPFTRLGALVESACIEEKRAFERVRHPRLLRRIASASGDVRLDRMPGASSTRSGATSESRASSGSR